MNQMKIGSFLKELRKENELTQEQLAEKLNVSNRSVSRWETGVFHSYRYYTTTHAYTVLQGNNFWINIKKLCQHPL